MHGVTLVHPSVQVSSACCRSARLPVPLIWFCCLECSAPCRSARVPELSMRYMICCERGPVNISHVSAHWRPARDSETLTSMSAPCRSARVPEHQLSERFLVVGGSCAYFLCFGTVPVGPRPQFIVHTRPPPIYSLHNSIYPGLRLFVGNKEAASNTDICEFNGIKAKQCCAGTRLDQQ